MIQESAIHVISARSEYEDIFPGDYYKWKIEAFKDLKRNYDEDVISLFLFLSCGTTESMMLSVVKSTNYFLLLDCFCVWTWLLQLITNLICLGDSNIEIEAAHVLAKGFSQSLIKTIKFRENPKPEELTKQQDLVADKFD